MFRKTRNGKVVFSKVVGGEEEYLFLIRGGRSFQVEGWGNFPTGKLILLPLLSSINV